MSLESRINRLEGLTPELCNSVLLMSDEDLQQAAREIIAKSTGYTGPLSTRAMVQVSHILIKCGGDLDQLIPEDRAHLRSLCGGDNASVALNQQECV